MTTPTQTKPGATPGPWAVTNATDVFAELGGSNGDGLAADSNDGWYIADCSPGPTFVGGELVEMSLDEKKANAQLFVDAGTIRARTGKTPSELAAEVERLARALAPFAACAVLFDPDRIGGNMPDTGVWQSWPRLDGDYELTVEHLREARAAIHQCEGAKA